MTPQRLEALAFPVGPWVAQQLGRGVPHPFTASLDELARYNQDKERLLFECLGDLGLGHRDPEPCFVVPQHDGRIVCASAFGAPYPAWDEVSGSFWLNNKTHVWEGMTAHDIKRLPIPQWERNPLVQENIRRWQETQRRVGTERARSLPLNWTELAWVHPTTGREFRFGVFPGFLDLGSFLMGSEEFLLTLATDPELADALLAKCFELSAGYSDFMCGLYDRKRTAWASLGGDNSCLVSADMYRRYAMRFDQRVRDKCGDLPRNLHSCGDSRHLFEVWAHYPERERIVLMQTRAVPGCMRPLRRALPHTYIQLTIHQPQVDFERESPGRIRDLVWQFAEDLEFRDLGITVLFSTADDRCKTNLAAFFDAAWEINARQRCLCDRMDGKDSP